MKAIEKFNGLSSPVKILMVLLALPVIVFIVGPLVSIFTLPIIGYFISLNSWRANRHSKDRAVFGLFVASGLLGVALFLTLRQPMFVTDWEGGNPLDNLIMFMMLGLLALVALFWALLGWVTHRLLAQAQGKKNLVNGKTL
jgi:hypothetical protein